jgi:hypothetical protein
LVGRKEMGNMAAEGNEDELTNAIEELRVEDGSWYHVKRDRLTRSPLGILGFVLYRWKQPPSWQVTRS